MKPYFEKMPDLGQALKKGQIKRTEDAQQQFKAAEIEFDKEVIFSHFVATTLGKPGESFLVLGVGQGVEFKPIIKK